MKKIMKKKGLDIEIDNLTNSIVNALSGDILQTEFNKITKNEINKSNWIFNWNTELKDVNAQIFKMTIKGNLNIIQGLISFSIEDKFIFINLVENAKFNRGPKKLYIGVGGNLFAFACLQSREMGFGGFVAFKAKTALISHYQNTLGASIALGQRMFINNESADNLIDKYFKK